MRARVKQLFRFFRFSVVCGVSLLCSSSVCFAATPSDLSYESWRLAVLSTGIEPDELVYPFDTTPAMESWAREKIERYGALGLLQKLSYLQDSLFRENHFVFEYDDDQTLTAAEAFESGRGNCMSFTLLFVALSRSIGAQASLVAVRRHPNVEKINDLVFINRHVVAGYKESNQLHLFDFSVTSSRPYLHHMIIDDIEASAMYYSNLGGAEIRAGSIEEARRHLKIATTLAPHWAPAWVNLGVVRSRSGDYQGALKAYETALGVDPDNSSALTNMAHVYRVLGMDEASRRALSAAAKSTASPFSLIAMADLEMILGNFSEAKRYLRKAKWWYSDEPEIYAAFSRLASHEGDYEKAEAYLRRAAALSGIPH